MDMLTEAWEEESEIMQNYDIHIIFSIISNPCHKAWHIFTPILVSYDGPEHLLNAFSHHSILHRTLRSLTSKQGARITIPVLAGTEGGTYMENFFSFTTNDHAIESGELGLAHDGTGMTPIPIV